MGALNRMDMDRIMEEHFAGEAAQDTARVLATLTADAEHDVVGLSPGKGADYIRGFYERLYPLLRQEDVRPVRRYYGEDFMVDEVVYTGHADGTLFGVEGRSGQVSVRMLHVVEFREGRISRENVWLDWGAGKEQILRNGTTKAVTPA